MKRLRDRRAVPKTVVTTVAKLALFWTAVGLVSAAPTLPHSQHMERSIASAFAQWWTWGILTPGIVLIDRLLPFRAAEAVKRFGVHLCIGLFTLIVYAYLHTLLRCVFGIEAWTNLLGSGLLKEAGLEVFWGLIIYFLIVGASQAYTYQRRYAEAELQLERSERAASEARLTALRTQLDPHFLFNTLNAVSSMVERDPQLARTMIEQLGGLLRSSLDSQGRQAIRLREELVFTERYLALQQIRFGDRLQVHYDVTPESRLAYVPSLLLQPLVENTVRHGFASRIEGGALTLSAKRHRETLCLQIEDNGVGLAPDWSLEKDQGTGLRVTRERLAVIYRDDKSDFTIEPSASGGTRICITVPWSTQEAVDA